MTLAATRLSAEMGKSDLSTLLAIVSLLTFAAHVYVFALHDHLGHLEVQV